MASRHRMTALELRASASLAGLYALRMLGLFLLLPVFTLYAQKLPGGDDLVKVGWAFGIYGLAQAVLQLPFGMLSDRIGRKRVIYIGLALMAVGCVLAAFAESVQALIVARTLQGTGAISAAVTALVADLTREEVRTQAMAMIGASIGLTFSVSLIVAPTLEHWIGVPGIFLMMAGLAVTAIFGVKFVVPSPAVSRFHSDAEANPRWLPTVLKDKQLLRLNFGVFVLHAAQMALFTVLPLKLVAFGLPKAQHWEVWLPTVLIGFFLMVPAIIYAEKRYKLKPVFVGAVALLLAAQVGMSLSLSGISEVLLWLTLYFIAFNVLEASQPSLISKQAPAAAKGTAIGVYNTCQSLGFSVGSAAGGWLFKHNGSGAVFAFCSVLVALWLLSALFMRPPARVKSELFHIGDGWGGDATDLSQRLAGCHGVREAVVMADEGVAYLKVQPDDWDEAAVTALIKETY